jgi:hypothetical protein
METLPDSPDTQTAEEAIVEAGRQYEEYLQLRELSTLGKAEERDSYDWSWNRSLTLQIRDDNV